MSTQRGGSVTSSASDFTNGSAPEQNLDHYAAGTASFNAFSSFLSEPLLLSQDAKSGCGGMTWRAGEVLGRYLLWRCTQDPEFRARICGGKKIVEVGSGTALTGLALAKGLDLEGSKIFVTDQENMIPIMTENIRLNNCQDTVIPAELDWGTTIAAELQEPDMVIAADCVYFEPAFPLLTQTMRDLTTPDTPIYFCYKKRRSADKHFFKMLKKHFVLEEIQDFPEWETFSRESIFLYRVIKR
ncbi:Protein-lysine N-methyltransferase efm6 [Saitoella coloradoensis]